MTRRRTRAGLKRVIEGAPQAHWRVSLVDPSDKIARKLIEYPEDSQGAGYARTFFGIAMLLPELAEVRVIPALGSSCQDEYQLFLAVIERRNTSDLESVFVEEFTHQTFGVVNSIRFYTEQPVLRCEMRGCASFGHWHNAKADGTRSDAHVADALRGDGYQVTVVHDGREWVPQVRIDHTHNGKPITPRAAADLSTDITWMLAEVSKLNTAAEVRA